MTDIKCTISCCIALFMIVLTPSRVQAKELEPVSLELLSVSNKSDEEGKNFRFSILGGPGYSPDYGPLVGGSTLMTFDLPSMKGEEMRRSVLPIAFALSFDGSLGYSLLVRPQLYIKQDKIRVLGEFSYSSQPKHYHGIGFVQNRETQRSSTTTQYRNNQININPIVMFRLAESDWFAGGAFSLQRDKITDPSQGVVESAEYQMIGGTKEGVTTVNNGVGLSFGYDSRDVPSTAYRGTYFDIKGLAYGKYFGGDYDYQLVELDFRQYFQLSKRTEGRTLAINVHSQNIFGDAPFTRLATIGSPFDLRGYYEGQYRDYSTHVAMVEYRHKFFVEPVNFLSKIASRLGFAVWMGAGALGSSPFEIEGFLPNFGAGLRFEVQPRMNFRVDVGYSPIERQTLVYLNMTEAF